MSTDAGLYVAGCRSELVALRQRIHLLKSMIQFHSAGGLAMRKVGLAIFGFAMVIGGMSFLGQFYIAAASSAALGVAALLASAASRS